MVTGWQRFEAEGRLYGGSAEWEDLVEILRCQVRALFRAETTSS